jgi:hypothetical protein
MMVIITVLITASAILEAAMSAVDRQAQATAYRRHLIQIREEIVVPIPAEELVTPATHVRSTTIEAGGIKQALHQPMITTVRSEPVRGRIATRIPTAQPILTGAAGQIQIQIQILTITGVATTALIVLPVVLPEVVRGMMVVREVQEVLPEVPATRADPTHGPAEVDNKLLTIRKKESKMKKIIFTATVLCLTLTGYSQDFVSNALLFSRTQTTGSARIQGMGGPKASLGGDYTSSLINPAGLGMYNRNEVTLTPALNLISSTSGYYGVSSPKESRSTFGVPGFSLVLNAPSNKESGYLGGSFAISMTRTNDFHQDFRYRARNDQNSIIDYFIDDAGDIDPSELLYDDIDGPGSYFYSLTALAYNNYLTEEIYDDNDNVVGYGTVLDFSSVRQEEISERKGSQTQWNISYGANFNDKFFAGINIGIASIRYKLSQVFREDDFNYNPDAPAALSDYSIIETYDIRGSGVNLGLGFIYRPIDFIQLGVSYLTPTYFGITDKYHARIESNWNNFEYYENEFLNGVYQEFPEEQISEYNITTPSKLNASVALIQKFGLFSANIEYVNYRKARYSSDIAGEFQGDNDAIKSDYVKTLNYNGGFEFRHDFMRYRIGAGYMSDPYENDDIDRSITTFAAGLGVKLKQFFVDFAVNHSMTKGNRIPYFTFVGNADPLASMKFQSTRYLMTVGFTF